MENNKKLSGVKAWALFGVSMVVVFCLGLLTSALMERRAEVASLFNNRKEPMKGEQIHAQNEDFRTDFPREYQTWRKTEETDFESKYNGSEAADVLEQRPEMVVLGQVMLSLGITPHLVDTCIPLRI